MSCEMLLGKFFGVRKKKSIVSSAFCSGKNFRGKKYAFIR